MEFRKAIETDIPDIMHIIAQAQAYFKAQGIDQWQNGYPNEEIIKNDILSGRNYVLIDGDKIAATVSVSFDGEKTYDTIYEGNWITTAEYSVIHRMAVDNAYKGLGLSAQIIEFASMLSKEKDIFSIKVDTHEDNISMQKALKKNGFQYCGIIYLEDGNKRVAFEKTLN